MTQALYAHMNNKTIKKLLVVDSQVCIFLVDLSLMLQIFKSIDFLKYDV
jgi:hypothetical protein